MQCLIAMNDNKLTELSLKIPKVSEILSDDSCKK